MEQKKADELIDVELALVPKFEKLKMVARVSRGEQTVKLARRQKKVLERRLAGVREKLWVQEAKLEAVEVARVERGF